MQSGTVFSGTAVIPTGGTLAANGPCWIHRRFIIGRALVGSPISVGRRGRLAERRERLTAPVDALLVLGGGLGYASVSGSRGFFIEPATRRRFSFPTLMTLRRMVANETDILRGVLEARGVGRGDHENSLRDHGPHAAR